MNSNQRSPLWPYLLVLGGLFALSLMVPGGFESGRDAPRPGTGRLSGGSANRSAARRAIPQVAIARPVPEAAALSQGAAGSAWWPAPGIGIDGQLSVPTDEGNADRGFFVDRVAEKIAGFRLLEAAGNLWPRNRVEPQDDWRPLESANSQTGVGSSSNNYPLPRNLLSQLERLSGFADCSGWAARVEGLCGQLCRVSPGDMQQAAEIVAQLDSLVQRADPLADQIKNEQAAAELRQVRYALERRLPLWRVMSSGSRQQVFANMAGSDQQRRQL